MVYQVGPFPPIGEIMQQHGKKVPDKVHKPICTVNMNLQITYGSQTKTTTADINIINVIDGKPM